MTRSLILPSKRLECHDIHTLRTPNEHRLYTGMDSYVLSLSRAVKCECKCLATDFLHLNYPPLC